MNFEEKNVIITGGAGGIGLEIVKKLLHEGISTVGIIDINNSNDVVQLLKKQFKNKFIAFYQADVTKRNEIKESFQKFIAEYKYVDIVIGNAGFLNEAQVEAMINVNMLGVINTTYEGINFMSKENGGRGGTIVNTSSIAGILYSPMCPVYNATKHAVLAFTKSLAHKITSDKQGISFITICPGVTETPFWTNTDDIVTKEFKGIATGALNKRGTQKPDELAKCFAEILAINKNDSIWVIEFGRYNEYVPPNKL